MSARRAHCLRWPAWPRLSLLLLGLLAAAGVPAQARAASSGQAVGTIGSAQTALEPRGRISLRDALLIDSLGDHDTNLLSGDVDIFLPRIRGSKLSLLFDGEFRRDLSSHPTMSAQQKEYDQLEPGGDEGEYIGRAERTIGKLRTTGLGDYIRSAYLEYAGLGDLLTVRAGRMLLPDLGQTWVDGAVLQGGGEEGLLIGAFGGLAPSPLDYGFNTDYRTFGAFGGYSNRNLLLRLAFNQSMVDAETDRRFVFSSGHAGLFDKVFLSYSATVDLAGQQVSFPEGDWKGEHPEREDLGPLLTMGFVNLLWWATPQVSFTLTGDTFRNVPFRVTRSAWWPTDFDRDIKTVLDELEKKGEPADPTNLPSWIQRLYLGDSTNHDPYYGLRFSPALRFADSWYGYLSLDWRSRELDDRQARFLSVGVRSDDLFRSGLAARVEYTARNNFLSDSNELFASLDRKFANRIDVGLYGTLIDGRSMASTFGRDLLLTLREQGADPRSAAEVSTTRLDQRQRVWLLGAALDIDITRRLYLLLDYDLTFEELIAAEETGDDSLTIHGFNARLTWRL